MGLCLPIITAPQKHLSWHHTPCPSREARVKGWGWGRAAGWDGDVQSIGIIPDNHKNTHQFTAVSSVLRKQEPSNSPGVGGNTCPEPWQTPP